METARVIFESARTYLVKRIDEAGESGEKVVRSYTEQPRIQSGKVALTKHLIHHSYNRQMGPRVIKPRITDAFHKIVFDYDPVKINVHWGGAGGDTELYKELIRTGIAPPKRVDQKWSYWGSFCKSIVDSAEFVSQLEYDRFISDGNSNQLAKWGAINLVASSIRGYGFALAADALKEAGIIDTVKPDVHIKKLGRLLHFRFANEMQLAMKIDRMCQEAAVRPYALDKLVWLIYSNNFYKHESREFNVSYEEWEKSLSKSLSLEQ